MTHATSARWPNRWSLFSFNHRSPATAPSSNAEDPEILTFMSNWTSAGGHFT